LQRSDFSIISALVFQWQISKLRQIETWLWFLAGLKLLAKPIPHRFD
jgi:hypothetical protein